MLFVDFLEEIEVFTLVEQTCMLFIEFTLDFLSQY